MQLVQARPWKSVEVGLHGIQRPERCLPEVPECLVLDESLGDADRGGCDAPILVWVGADATMNVMSDQLGRHDATGPLARDAGGRVDPEGYVRSALQGRESLLLHGFLAVVYALLVLVRGFGWPGAFIVFGILVALDLLLVCVIRGTQWWTERGRRLAGHSPSWRARVFVLQARTQGIEIPRPIRGDSRLAGRLTDCGDHWAWMPSKPAGTKGVLPIDLRSGWAPRVTERIGSHGIATFDTPSPDGPRLDFWVARRRDLEHHLMIDFR